MSLQGKVHADGILKHRTCLFWSSETGSPCNAVIVQSAQKKHCSNLGTVAGTLAQETNGEELFNSLQIVVCLEIRCSWRTTVQKVENDTGQERFLQ